MKSESRRPSFRASSTPLDPQAMSRFPEPFNPTALGSLGYLGRSLLWCMLDSWSTVEAPDLGTPHTYLDPTPWKPYLKERPACNSSAQESHCPYPWPRSGHRVTLGRREPKSWGSFRRPGLWDLLFGRGVGSLIANQSF